MVLAHFELGRLGFSSDLIILNSKFEYIGLYTRVSCLLGIYAIICEFEL